MEAVREVRMKAMNVCWVGILLVLIAPALLAGGANWTIDFENRSLDDWYLPDPEVWTISNESGNHVLHLTEGGLMGMNPRRPVRFGLFKPGCVGNFDLRLRLRKDPKQGESDLLIAFGYQDRLHFYYAHLSNDGENPKAHNGLFKVDNADRLRIAGLGAKPALSDAKWHDVRIERNTASGSIKVFMDKEPTPIFQVIDSSLAHGLVGFGSFNDTGVFDDIVLSGTPSDKCGGPVNTLDPPDTSP
jgi:hypothetical protein